MRSPTVAIAMEELLDGVTLTVTIKRTRWFDLRMQLGVAMIKLGAHICGFGTVRVDEQ